MTVGRGNVWVAVLVVALALPVGAGAESSADPGSVTQPAAVQPPSVPAAPGRGPGAVLAMEARGPVTDMCGAQAAMIEAVSLSGGQRVVGDYRVAYILAPPRGWYMPSGGRLVWRAPARGETQHIEAVVLDSLTGKPLPVMPTLDVLDQRGRVVQTQQLMFLWHPQADHYGANYAIPTAGTYTLRVRAPAPMIGRHSRELGQRFTQPIDVSFTGVQITPMPPPPNEVGTGQPAGLGGTGVTQPGAVCPPGTVTTPAR